MVPTQRLPALLTRLDVALAALTGGLAPVAPVALPLPEALGCVAADMPAVRAFPLTNIAVVDGWALSARDSVGASSYSPLRLGQSPVWVEAGDRIPEACDCVVDSDSVAQTDGMVELLAEAIPGQGVCRIGGHIAQGSPAIIAGRRVRPLDLLRARAAGLQSLNVCRPRLSVVNIPATSGSVTTARLIVEGARNCGVHVVCAEASGRDAQAIATAIDAGTCDLLVTTGGSGVGRNDAVIAALASRGQVVAHGMALRPGRTSAVGRIGNVPVIALPGAPDQALAAWWTLVLPVLDRLCGRQPPPTLALPLRRKIASSVGIAEIVLLERSEGAWMPLAVGDISLDTIAQADAWLAVPASSEGFATGTPVGAYMLRE